MNEYIKRIKNQGTKSSRQIIHEDAQVRQGPEKMTDKNDSLLAYAEKHFVIIRNKIPVYYRQVN
jgi:hypothetical protein